MNTEKHPLQPFLPSSARVLMLGSFPPPRARWSMDFFYPNFSNDMWRVIGEVFFGDKDKFVDMAQRTFRLSLLYSFLEEKGIALYDTATEIRRLHNNASDKFLEVSVSTDVPALVRTLPALRAVVTTGQKASDTLARMLLPFGVSTPPLVGGSQPFVIDGRPLRFYRMPSTSRAYPLPLAKKAAAYAAMFSELGILQKEA